MPPIDPARQSIAIAAANQLAKRTANDNHPSNRPPLLILIVAPLSS